MTTLTEAPTPVETRPLEPTTPIKPSEALRLGRLIRPLRITGSFFKGDDGACAIGAIHLGWGGEPSNDPTESGIASTLRRIEDVCSFNTGATLGLGSDIFDVEQNRTGDGDAAVLAYLAERGL